MNRPVDPGAWSGVPLDLVRWDLVVGAAGAPAYPTDPLGAATAQSGGDTTIVARARPTAPNCCA
jgi:hypothetical protein